MGQAAYFGVGAYLTAVLATKMHSDLPGISGWWSSSVSCSERPWPLCLACSRSRAGGVYFLMITLALGQCVLGPRLSLEFAHWRRQRVQISAAGQISVLDLGNEVTFFYPAFAFFAVSLAVDVRAWCARHLGKVSPVSASVNCGCNFLASIHWLHKYIAFIIAGGFGGLAGVLWAQTNGHVSPETVVLTTSVIPD